MYYFYIIVVPAIAILTIGAMIFFVTMHPGSPPDPTKKRASEDDLEEQMPLTEDRKSKRRAKGNTLNHKNTHNNLDGVVKSYRDEADTMRRIKSRNT